MAPMVALNWRSVLTHVGVGMGAASFWRGAWYVLDDHLFPEDAAKSALASWTLGVGGMAASQGLMARCERLAEKASDLGKTSRHGVATKHYLRRLQVARFGALYTIAVSCVLVWRGTWVGWDVFYEYTHPKQSPCQTAVKSTAPGHATASGLISHVVAVTALVGTGLFASVLAPPAATGVLRDWAIKTSHTANPYSGPAGKLVELFWNPRNPAAAHAVVARRGYTATPARSLPPKARTPWPSARHPHQ